MVKLYNPAHFTLSTKGVLSVLSSLLTLAGDVTGAISANIVAKIRGRAVSAAAPADEDVLAWDAGDNRWEPTAITAGGIGAVPADVTLTWPMSGGALDYTLDPNFTRPTGYTAGNSDTSQLLGDGALMPLFYCTARDKVAANGLTRTTGNRLRLQPVSTITSFDVMSSSSPSVVIPLPACTKMSVEFTMVMANFNTKERVEIGVYQTTFSEGSSENQWAALLWRAQSTTSVTEDRYRRGALFASGSSTIDSYVSSNVCTRHYRLELDPYATGIFGAAVGAPSNANTLLNGGGTLNQALARRQLLVITTGVTSGTFTAGFYGEIADITVNGTRFFF